MHLENEGLAGTFHSIESNPYTLHTRALRYRQFNCLPSFIGFSSDKISPRNCVQIIIIKVIFIEHLLCVKHWIKHIGGVILIDLHSNPGTQTGHAI